MRQNTSQTRTEVDCPQRWGQPVRRIGRGSVVPGETRTTVRPLSSSRGGAQAPWGLSRLCGRQDLNLHVFRHQDLNLARLPLSPRPRVRNVQTVPDSAETPARIVVVCTTTLPGARSAPARLRANSRFRHECARGLDPSQNRVEPCGLHSRVRTMHLHRWWKSAAVWETRTENEVPTIQRPRPSYGAARFRLVAWIFPRCWPSRR